MKKILYVEDNYDTANVVKLILGVLGYKVDLAHDGEEGKEKIMKNDYDLIIFDIMLPDISGLKLFEIAKRKNKTKKTKYVFLTITYIPVKKREKLRAQGLNDIIAKPFNKEDLVKRIGKVLEIKPQK